MKPFFSLNQSTFYYPGQEIRIPSANSFFDKGEDFKQLEKGRVRLIFIAVFFVFAFVLIAARLFEYTVLKEKATTVSKPSSIAALTPPISRADITDRTGTIIATSLPVVNLYSDNTVSDNSDEVATALLNLFPDLSFNVLQNRLQKKSSFVYLKRNLTPKEQYEVNKLGYPSLKFEKGERRVYPQGNLFSHVLGFVDLDNKGISGLEKSFNDKLTQNNIPLQLSLDTRVQYRVHNILSEQIKYYKAQGATAVVMDVTNSEIIAMVSLPDFDPNNQTKSNPDNLFNKASLGVYEFGSVFKVFNAALALDTGIVFPNDKVDSSSFYQGSKLIKDDHPENRPLTLKEILAYSSNTASARLALKAGNEKQLDFFRKLHFLEDLNIEIPETGHPLFPKRWPDIAVITASYGYGISVTPLHVITALAALVNGGVYRPATVIHKSSNDINEGERIISEQHSAQLAEMLEYVVSEGTAKKSKVYGYSVGGKTGTAEKIGTDGKFNKKSVRSSFISIFPTNKPKYAMIVMLDDPKGLPETYGFRTAGWNAVPTSQKIIENIAPLLDVVPDLALNTQ